MTVMMVREKEADQIFGPGSPLSSTAMRSLPCRTDLLSLDIRPRTEAMDSVGVHS